jgi:hypothetical protein
MRISRRQFAYGLAGVAAAVSAVSTTRDGLCERRVYAPGSLLPPREVLQRHGIHASLERQRGGTVYSISFASAEARVKAWDRFNADEDWCAIRDRGRVALEEVQIYPAGKIFEISL